MGLCSSERDSGIRLPVFESSIIYLGTLCPLPILGCIHALLCENTYPCPSCVCQENERNMPGADVSVSAERAPPSPFVQETKAAQRSTPCSSGCRSGARGTPTLLKTPLTPMSSMSTTEVHAGGCGGRGACSLVGAFQGLRCDVLPAVYTRHMTWVPLGNQADLFPEGAIRPVRRQPCG